MRYAVRSLVPLLLLVVFFPLHVADATTLDAKLQRMMIAGNGPFDVIVTFNDRADISTLNSIGTPYYALSRLPMAHGRYTTAQIQRLAQWKSVRSIYLNSELQYYNHDAGQVTGAHYVQNTLGFKGTGVVINVLDSGIDGTREDVFFDTGNPSAGKVIQNAKITVNPNGSYTVQEDVQNTDNTSGHGTHVAGTAAGDGLVLGDAPARSLLLSRLRPRRKDRRHGRGRDARDSRGPRRIQLLARQPGALRHAHHYQQLGGAGDFSPDNPISVAAFEAYCAGMVVTFAAGNDGPDDDTLSVYASNPWVIGVGATNDLKVLTDFSSRGTAGDPFEHPSICAPGSGIRSVRAPGTPFGDYQPFVDLNCPVCTVCYTSLSGTSMSTPFIAGAVALMLDANPDLSPDQVMDIMYTTAEPMPGYQFHEVGHGFVDVQAAVEAAVATDGKLDEFLAGDRKWSSRGFWDEAEQDDPLLGYFGTWTEVSDPNATDGSYTVGTSGSATFRAIIYGRGIKIEHPVGPTGAVARLYLDDQFVKTIDFNHPTFEHGHVTAIPCQDTDVHVVDIRWPMGDLFIDKIYADFELLESNRGVVEESKSFSGLIVMGTTTSYPFEVGTDVVGLRGELSWPEVADVDLYLFDPNGVQISGSSGATLGNPEIVDVSPTIPGTYRWDVTGYAGAANYTLVCTQTKLTDATDVTPASSPFALWQCVPNPFNPSTTIRYKVGVGGPVTLEIFDVSGRLVTTLVNQFQNADEYRVVWNATDQRGGQVASGVYFYRLRAGSFNETRKMVLLK